MGLTRRWKGEHDDLPTAPSRRRLAGLDHRDDDLGFGPDEEHLGSGIDSEELGGGADLPTDHNL